MNELTLLHWYEDDAERERLWHWLDDRGLVTLSDVPDFIGKPRKWAAEYAEMLVAEQAETKERAAA